MTFVVETIQGSVQVCVSKNQCFDFSQTWRNDPFDDFKWKIFEYQVFRAHQDLHLI